MKFHTSKFRAYVENSPIIYRSHVHAENWEYYKCIRNEHGTKRDIGRGGERSMDRSMVAFVRSSFIIGEVNFSFERILTHD